MERVEHKPMSRQELDDRLLSIEDKLNYLYNRERQREKAVEKRERRVREQNIEVER